jgi:hypothetical protein
MVIYFQANTPKNQPQKVFRENLVGTMSELAGMFN